MFEHLDVPQHIAAATRVVRSGERDGQPSRLLIVGRTFDAPVGDLWDAITSAERIPQWFLPITGDLRVGGRYQLAGHAGGEILACEPMRRFAATWEFDGDVSWVEVRVSAVDGGHHVELEHAARPNPEWDERGFGPGAVGIGWEMMLLGLALHLSSGAPLDPEEVGAWQVSDGAKDFMRASNDGWCAADIASGTPADAARAAADRTIAAYIGEG